MNERSLFIEALDRCAGAERADKDQREQFLEIAQGMDRAAKANDDIRGPRSQGPQPGGAKEPSF